MVPMFILLFIVTFIQRAASFSLFGLMCKQQRLHSLHEVNFPSKKQLHGFGFA